MEWKVIIRWVMDTWCFLRIDKGSMLLVSVRLPCKRVWWCAEWWVCSVSDWLAPPYTCVCVVHPQFDFDSLTSFVTDLLWWLWFSEICADIILCTQHLVHCGMWWSVLFTLFHSLFLDFKIYFCVFLILANLVVVSKECVILTITAF